MAIFFDHIKKTSCLLAALVLCAGYLHAAPLDGKIASLSPGEARLRVLAAAGKYEHTPYRYGGMDKRGFDCSGFVYTSFHDALGVSIPRSSPAIYSWAEKISKEEVLPGDLVFFKTMGNGKVSHVGIYVGDGRFIHSASEGPVTGVIYSSLNERYWSRTYLGMGRALPKADMNGGAGASGSTSISDGAGAQNDMDGKKTAQETPAKKQREGTNLLMGVAVAPTWNTYTLEGSIIRGAAGQVRLGTEVKPFGLPMIFGLELRPEWDGALGVFRIPLTLSWGLNDKLRIFAGPALSFGDASLSVSGENRTYSGGTAWFGSAGITVAPFKITIAGNDLAPYGELAWQSYYNNNNNEDIRADAVAGFRFSTGLRFTWRT